jgi:hypothetical protein
MKKTGKRLVLMALGWVMVLSAMAQVTTSSISGKVVDAQESLIGATVQATHIPSGTKYGTVTNTDGRFALQGLRPGGPYKIVVAYLGHVSEEITDVNIPLGETLKLDAVLKEKTSSLSEVVVVASASKFNVERTGATTNISQEKMATIPTISRSISDIARLSPYANGMGFAGGDGRSSNFTVDGANLNNNFGLSSSLPGGGSPISLDAIQEVQVVVAPFDVRQSNFIGGGVNAITKSGTNDFKGTAYMYTTNQQMRGNKIGDYSLGARLKESTTSYGFTFGGPIIKNKLFFFANIESEKSPGQVVDWRASTDGVTDHQRISRVTEKDLQTVSDFLKTKYGYNTGSFSNFPGDRTNFKWLGRLDWNITNNHKLSVRYNHTKNTSWNAPNGNSTDGSYRDSGKNRMSEWSMSYANSMYSMENIVNSGTAELNSRFGNKISNQLLFTYSDIQDIRGTNSSEFPFIDIMSGDIATTAKAALDPYISAGYELFTFNNGVKNKITTVTDNFTYYLNAHKITGGLSFEHQMADNNYMRNGTGYYRYKSITDLVNGAAPVDYALTYGTNGKLVPSNAVAFSQFGAYAQDEWNIKPNLKFTVGVRADYLVFTNDIMTNNAILNLDFGGRHINTGEWAKAKVNLSPRIGFNWDIKNDKSIVLRGGTGLFTGRLPLVFFTNMPSNAGMNQILKKVQTVFNSDGSVKTKDPLLSLLAGGIITDPAKAIEKLGFQTVVTPKDGSVPSSIAGVDRNFRMPQVWKTALAVDYKIPVGFPLSATLEATYTKNIYAVKLDNYAVKNPDATWKTFSGSDNRYIYPASYTYNSVKDACVLTNTSKGYGYTANVTVNAQPVKNLDVMAAYTHTEMKEVSGMPGSNANSAWVGVYSINGPNTAGIQRSQYVVPDRIIANVSYRLPSNTTVSVYYTGYSPYGNTFYYTNDMNGDGNKSDLIYIPKNRGDIKFKTQADEDAFFAFMEQDSYLKNHKGEYAEANAARAPFVHRFDLKFVQDVKVNVGKTKHVLSFGLDVMNFGNLLNSTWGVMKNMAASNYGQILTYESKDANNVPTFSMYKVNGAYPTKTYDRNLNKGQCWSLQVSVKYRFN